MQRFKKILFVNDPNGNAPALQRAVRLARANDAKLAIASVSEEIPRSLAKHRKAFLQVRVDEIQTLLEQVTWEDLNIEIRHLVGTPFLEIIKEVSNSEHDLVIKPAEGRGGISNGLFGSTDLHLMRKCPCPVWIIKPSRRKKYARILAAVDPDPGEKANAELNKLILDLAISLTQQEGSELHIVHAWRMAYESTLRSGRAHLSKLEVDRLVRDIRKDHKKRFEVLLDSYGLHNLSAKIHLLKGDPSDVVPALAKKKRVELVVMGTIARTGIPGFFIGNTAEKTLAEVDCSVLAVKPKAFSTPVEN